MTEIQELARFYKALADETRLRLVARLARQRRGHALCVGRLASDLGVTASAISQHLRVLKDLGLVERERHGMRIHYYLKPDRLAEYQGLAGGLLGDAFILRRTSDPNTVSDEEDNMKGDCCCHKESCENPEELQSNPCECSPEQIKECHGDAEEHVCAQAPKKE